MCSVIIRLYVRHDRFIRVRLIHLYPWHDSFKLWHALSHMCDMTHFIFVIQIIYVYDLNHWYVWHDSLICVTWRDSFICVTRLIDMCAMTLSLTCVTWFIHTRDITQTYVQCCLCIVIWVHDSFMCATTTSLPCVAKLIHTRDTTHPYVWYRVAKTHRIP